MQTPQGADPRPPEAAAAHAPDAAAATGAPKLGQLIAALPLVLLIVGIGLWTWVHFDSLLGLIGSTGVLGSVLAFWSFLPEDTTQGVRLGFARALASRRLFNILSVLLVVFVVVTMFVTSVRVTAEDTSDVMWIYKMHPSGDDEPTADSVVGSSRVDLQACKLEYSIVSPK